MAKRVVILFFVFVFVFVMILACGSLISAIMPTPTPEPTETATATAQVVTPPVLVVGKFGQVEMPKSYFEVQQNGQLDLGITVISYIKGSFYLKAVVCHYPDGSAIYLDRNMKLVGDNKMGFCTGAVRIVFENESGRQEELSVPIIINVTKAGGQG